MAHDANLPIAYDDILLSMDEQAFINLVADALRDYRDGKDLAFAKEDDKVVPSKLAYSSLVLDCLLEGEALRVRALGLGVLAMLRWGVEQLWPGPKPGGMERGWRLFAALYYPYFEQETFEGLAERLAVSTGALFDWRREALAEVAIHLRRELVGPQHHLQRKHYALTERYLVYQVNPDDQTHEQRLLRFCALLRHPMPVQQLQALVEQIRIPDAQACLDRLRLDGWLGQEGEQLLTCLRDEDARVYLYNRLTVQEQRTWCDYLALQANQQGKYLAAAEYWCVGEHFQLAAELLSSHFQGIVHAGQSRKLFELYEQIANAPLERNTLGRLKIAVGRASLAMKNVGTARRFFEDALNAPDNLIKADACYYLGKTWEKVLTPQAHHYFNYGIQLLYDLVDESLTESEQSRRDTLLANLYIGQAWLHILHASEVTRAEEMLSKAEVLIGKTAQQYRDDLNQALVNLYNALAGHYARQDNTESELRHYHNAVIVARALGDRERLWRILQNLAQSYIHDRQYEPGLLFLAEAEQVAHFITSQEGIGKCAQTRGAYHFFLADDQRKTGLDPEEQLRKAIEHYLTATEIFRNLGDDHWLAAAHTDLAEAHIALRNLASAQQHYQEATTHARLADAEDVRLQVLNQLEVDYPAITVKNLSPRELFALHVVQEKGAIRSGELMRLASVGKSTAERTLEKLVKLDLLKQVGKGRSTRYVSPKVRL